MGLAGRIDKKRKVRLFHLLLDEGISFYAWMRKQIDEYLTEKEPKGKPRKRKED